MSKTTCAALILVWSATGWMCDQVIAAEPPAPPPVSKFAPADDLVAQVNAYVDEFAAILASAKEFEKGQAKLQKDANTLAVVALALALHDSDHPLRHHASVLLGAAQQLATADNYEAAKPALNAMQAAVRRETSAERELHWEKVASQEQLMKQVTFLNNRLKRGAKPGPRFEAQADENARYAALLAVIGQAAMSDTHEVKDPTKVDEWYQFCVDMRDAAGAANAALHGRDVKSTSAALQRLEQSCKDCHRVFRKEQP